MPSKSTAGACVLVGGGVDADGDAVGEAALPSDTLRVTMVPCVSAGLAGIAAMTLPAGAPLPKTVWVVTLNPCAWSCCFAVAAGRPTTASSADCFVPRV